MANTRGSTLPVRGGKREMKAYAVTEDELENLGLISIGSTFTFSLASFLGAFFLSVRTSIAFASDVKPEVLSYWQGVSTAAAIGAAVLLVVGVILLVWGHSKIGRIKKGTDHG
jgi:hypothetical protein